MTTTHRNALPFNDNLVANIRQRELTDQQRERLVSAMSLRKTQLENYSSEMLRTQCHEFCIMTRTAVQAEEQGPSKIMMCPQSERRQRSLKTGRRKGRSKCKKGNRRRAGLKPFRKNTAGQPGRPGILGQERRKKLGARKVRTNTGTPSTTDCIQCQRKRERTRTKNSPFPQQGRLRLRRLLQRDKDLSRAFKSEFCGIGQRRNDVMLREGQQHRPS